MESDTTGSNAFSWNDVNWKALERLRARFLSFDPREAGPASDPGDSWRSHSELASYDFTFGERIGWKWDTVIAELKARGWMPPAGAALDWGCGTGVAGRRVALAWPERVRTLRLYDRSEPARRFAARQAAARGIAAGAAPSAGADAPKLLIVSHALNELDAAAFGRLLAVAERAEAVLWVEPGTHPVSRRLVEARERLLKAGFRAVAPCPHRAACGLLAPGNEAHWCHHFARVPGQVFTDPGWGRFAQTLKIDLAALPMSFLVLDRREPPPAVAEGNGRLLGEPRFYKGFAKLLACQGEGSAGELTMQKRDSPEAFKRLKKDPGSLYRWEIGEGKIRSGQRVF